MKYTLRTKFFVLLILLVLVAVGMNSWLHVNTITQTRKDDFESRAVALSQFIGLQYVDPLLKDNPERITEIETIKFWIDQDQQSDAEYIELYNTDGKKLISYSKPEYSIPYRDELTPKFLQSLLHSNKRFVTSTFPEQQTFDFLVPVKLNNTHMGIVRIGLDASVYYDQRSEAIMTNVRYGSIFLLLISLIAYVATPYIVQPIRDLAQVARDFGEGNYNTRSMVTSGDELEELSLQFNRMADQIERLIENLTEASHYHRIFPFIVVPRKLYTRISRHIQQNIDVPYMGLVLNQPDANNGKYLNYLVEQGELTAVESSEAPPPVLSELADLTSLEQGNTGQLVKRSRKASELTEFFRTPDENQLTDGIVFPLGENDELGYLVLARNDRDFPDGDLRLVNSIRGQISTAISNAQNFERVLVDERSGLYPRKVMHLALNESGRFSDHENLWMARFGIDEPVVVPTEGDIHLKVARFIHNQGQQTSPLSDTDHFFVASHDESWQFLAILSGWNQQQARTILEDILAELEENSKWFHETTLSAGVTSINRDDSTEELLERGQQALEEAHDQGGSTVWFAD